jgi:adenine-specific DNA methylase
MNQIPLFVEETDTMVNFPSTRFQGSKRKLASWIYDNLSRLEFDTVLDVFGGTSAVSYLFKRMGKQVIYNDYLSFNWNIGLALIENSETRLTTQDVDLVLRENPNVDYPNFIQRTFSGIYFTDEENLWLDRVIYNINHLLDNHYKKSLARFALFQAAIIKRPYNLFHRANLYMRNANVKRSFGNKATWDTPFESHFRGFVDEANGAVFDNQRHNCALKLDAFETPIGSDLVYLDPPYLNSKGIGIDYRDVYHFLEGLVNYDDWTEIIDYKSKHKRLKPRYSKWNKAGTIVEAFDTLIARHRHSTIIISYRDNGLPSYQQLIDTLRIYKTNVNYVLLPKQYALSKSKSHELLLIAT